MAAGEVLLGVVVDAGRRVRAEDVHEDGLGVRTGDGVHGVELHLEVGAGDERLDEVEVEHLPGELEVVRDGVDHLNLKVAELGDASLGEVHVGDVRHLERVHGLGEAVNLVGDLLGRGLAGGVVELDPPVLLGAAGVVRGGHDEAAVCLARANHSGGGGGGEEAVLADVNLAHAVAGGELDDDLRRFLVKPATVAAENHRGALHLLLGEGEEQRLDPVREVVALGEHGGLLPETGGARLLALDGGGGDVLDLHAGRRGRGEAHFLWRGSHALGSSSEGRLLGELPTDRNAGTLGEHGRVHLASLRLEGGVCRGATKSAAIDDGSPHTYTWHVKLILSTMERLPLRDVTRWQLPTSQRKSLFFSSFLVDSRIYYSHPICPCRKQQHA